MRNENAGKTKKIFAHEYEAAKDTCLYKINNYLIELNNRNVTHRRVYIKIEGRIYLFFIVIVKKCLRKAVLAV